MARGRRPKAGTARRDAILRAALEEFSAHGFEAARLDDVARRAGIAKGTIYLYFRDKEALFQELVRTEMSPVVGTLEQVAHVDAPIRTVAEQFIELFVREVVETHRKDVMRLVLSEGPRFPKLAEFYYREVLSRALIAVRGLLQRAMASGEIGNDVLLRFPQLVAAPAVVAILWRALFDRFEPLDVRAMLRAHFDLVFGGEHRP
ncbi:MAG TPA: TetR/AcrR family transcriptional regulator [Xanthobacteraceae bacterium]|nr:TetR/AcrR family transcriptional regulator [Xanthobacteraceae bacterium]